MRISLLAPDGTFTPLAGQAGVAENVHSSASGIRIEPEISIQEDQLVRGTHRVFTDRGNLGNTLTFSSIRTFSTTAAAEVWAQDYDANMTRTGTLVTDTGEGNGYAQSLTITGTLTADGTTSAVFPEMIYAGISYLKPYFEDEADNSTLVSWTGTVWVLELSGFGPLATSTADVASPEMVPSGEWDAESNPHAWRPTDPATGLPEIAATFAGRRYYTNAIVLPPARRLEGCSVLLSYTVRAGACSATI